MWTNRKEEAIHMKKTAKPELIIFSKNLRKYYERWEKEKGKKGYEDFADALSQYSDGDHIPTRFSISDWMNAKSKPRMYMSAICTVLGVSEEDLNAPDNMHDRYTYDLESGKEFLNSEKVIADSLGLTPEFMRLCFKAIDPSDFPIWTSYTKAGDMSDSHVARKKPGTAPEIDGKEYETFQIKVRTENGKSRNVYLSEADLYVMKKMQDEVISYIDYLVYKRKEEMKRELAEIQAKTYIKDKETGIVTEHALSNETICQIDPVADYLYQKYHSEKKEG